MVEKNSRRTKKLGAYTVEKEIGRGSAAIIHLARQESLGRHVVIKELLPQHAANKKLIARFRREARILSGITHDAIAHVYDTWDKGSTICIAMEYVEGRTLGEILAQYRVLPLSVASVILYQVSRGLEAAHEFGVVHRDLKPANIMVSKSGQVKILDFGIAHFDTEEPLTSHGAVIGTYHYMSPEQAMGKDVTAASDIFSLGILYYEMLTGTKPFVKDDKGDILEKIIRKGFRSPQTLNPAIPWRAARIIRKCLRKKPKRRFKDIGQAKAGLEKILRRTSIDHSRFLQKTMETLVPVEPDLKGPPNVWKRTGFRLTHMRIQTYVILGFGLFLFMFLEILLMSRGIGLSRQARKFRSFFHSRKVRTEVRIPEAPMAERPSGTVMVNPSTQSDSTLPREAGKTATPDTAALKKD